MSNKRQMSPDIGICDSRLKFLVFPRTMDRWMMDFVPVDKQKFLAVLERIASFTVGVAVENNTGVGTGTLIADGDRRFVLTAEHVVRDSDAAQIRFWCKPSSRLVEKAAHEVSNAEIGKLTQGHPFPIESIVTNPDADLALLTLDPRFKPPGSAEFFDLSASQTLARPNTNLEGVSLVCFGFPVANSRPIASVGNHSFSFLGCVSHACYYDSDLNSNLWNRISSSISRELNFVLRYTKEDPYWKPEGFSGCGVWVAAESTTDRVWKPDPLLAGVVHRYVEKLDVLIASKLSTILDTVGSH